MRPLLTFCGALLWAAAALTPAQAHDRDLASLYLTQNGETLSVALVLSQAGAEELAGLPEHSLKPANAPALAEKLMRLTLGRGSLRDETGALCPWGPARSAMESSGLVLRLEARCPATAHRIQLELPFVDGSSVLKGGLNVVVTATIGDQVQSKIADRDHPRLSIDGESSRGFAELLRMGMSHIGVAASEWRDAPTGALKLPEGIDHLLFLLALVLATEGLVSIFKSITGFTLGHSIALLVAAMGWVTLPGRIVEPAIALTIAAVAASHLFEWFPATGWKVATGFGLIHGLGFAGALAGIGVEGWERARVIGGFNLGVELGQIVVIAILLPVLWASRKSALLYRGIGVGILTVSLFWCFKRVFGS
jgi:hypothetical protein